MSELSPCYIIRIYVPLDRPYTPGAARRYNARLRKVIKELHDFEKVGKLGTYDDVYNLSPAREYYTPGPGSTPSEGKIGVESGKHMVMLTTYAIGVSIAYLEDFFVKVKEAIGWEHPVIECYGPEGALVWMPPPTQIQ